MQERLTIARPYAEAAFDIAAGSSAIDDWSSQLTLLATMVSDADLAAVISDPRVPDSRLNELITSIAGEKLSGPVGNLVKVLIESGRLSLAPEIAAIFEQARAAAGGVQDIEMHTAFEVSDEQRNTVSAAIKSRIGKDVSLTTAVDESLIGGAVIRIGDSVIDASVRGRLNQLATEL